MLKCRVPVFKKKRETASVVLHYVQHNTSSLIATMADITRAMSIAARGLGQVQRATSSLSRETGAAMDTTLRELIYPHIPACKEAMGLVSEFCDNFSLFDAATCLRDLQTHRAATLMKARTLLHHALDFDRFDAENFADRFSRSDGAAEELQREADKLMSSADADDARSRSFKHGGRAVSWIPLIGAMVAAGTGMSAAHYAAEARKQRQKAGVQLADKRAIVDRVVPSVAAFLNAVAALEAAIEAVEGELDRFGPDSDIAEFAAYTSKFNAANAEMYCEEYATAARKLGAL
jgi:predicted component of type VI protein secretion system